MEVGCGVKGQIAVKLTKYKKKPIDTTVDFREPAHYQ